MELKYTIAFIKKGDKVLLLNRESPSWMGKWNGVGGKIEANETPDECILREIEEETGIQLDVVTYKGNVTWEAVDGSYAGGMYSYTVELPDTFEFPTPIKKDEGILDWKTLDWIMHPKNEGTANLHYFIKRLIHEETIYQHRFVYDGNDVAKFESIVLQETVDIS